MGPRHRSLIPAPQMLVGAVETSSLGPQAAARLEEVAREGHRVLEDMVEILPVVALPPED